MNNAFFSLGGAVSDYGDFILKREIYEHFAEVNFFTGQRLAGRFPETIIGVGFWRRALDYFELGSVNVVSARMREFFEREQVNAEFIEIEVVVWPRFRRAYYFMNVLDVIACMDRNESRFTESELPNGHSRIEEISRLCLDERKIGTTRLLVLAEKVQILARGDLVDAIRSEGFTGVSFTPLPDGHF